MRLFFLRTNLVGLRNVAQKSGGWHSSALLTWELPSYGGRVELNQPARGQLRQVLNATGQVHFITSPE